jgi:ribosomal protein S6--L-glutamate ligase
MRIGILSRSTSLYSTTRLREAARERGHEVRVVNPVRCYMDITARSPKVLYRGEPLLFDAIIPRIGASITFYGTAVVRQFEIQHVFTVVESQSIARSRDKLRSLQLLSREGVGLPVTGFARSMRDIDGLIDLVGGAPLIIKLLEGTQGVGVVLAETRKAAHSVIGAFQQLDANILVQEFIKEAGGSDLRAFVVGARVVAAMERHAAPGEFRSNLHRGGTANPVQLTTKERNTAIRAARVMGLAVAGVDMLRSDRGPVVMEVNSSPGLEGIERASGVDVAGEIIEYIEGHVTTDEPAGSAPKGKAKRASGAKGAPARTSKGGSGGAEGTAAAEPAEGAGRRKGRRASSADE